MKTARVNTPDQDKAIKSLMTKLRNRQKNAVGLRRFPRFGIGMKTREYVDLFCADNNYHECHYLGNLNRPAPSVVGEEVVDETLRDPGDFA
jgi:hypothetical protein